MARRIVNLFELWLTLAYLMIPVAAFGLAGYLRFGTGYFANRSADPTPYLACLLLVTLVWGLVVQVFQLNRVKTVMAFNTGIKAMAKANAYTIAVVLTLLFFYRDVEFSRIFVALSCLLMFVFSVLVLHLFRTVVLARRRLFRRSLRVAILGADAYAARIAQHLQSLPFVPVEIACFVSLDHEPAAIHSKPMVDCSRVENAVDTYGCEEVLVALPLARLSELQKLIEPLRHLCVPVRVVLDVGEGLLLPERIFSFQGLPLFDLHPYPVDSIGYVIGKRIFDILFSTAALLVTAPLMAVIAAAIKLTSPGPILFSQERVSLNGKRFRMLKLRTMYVQDPVGSSTHHTARDDPRITSVGRLLRKSSLDELPQFINVIRGHMSVVGPRPELTFYVQKFRQEIPAYMARHNVKCGITGLAQVRGFRGSDTSIPERIEHDLLYLENWSMVLDFKIILQTVFMVIAGKNAY